MEKSMILIFVVIALVAIGFFYSSFLSTFDDNELNNDPPIIHHFTATPEIVNFGEISVLNWSVSGANSVQIDGIDDSGMYSYFPFSGSVIVAANKNKTYTLTAYNEHAPDPAINVATSNTTVTIVVNRSTILPIDFETYEPHDRLVVTQTDGNLRWRELSIQSSTDVFFHVGIMGDLKTYLLSNISHAIVDTDVESSQPGDSEGIIQESDYISFGADKTTDSVIIKIYQTSTNTLLGIYVIQSIIPDI